MITRRGLLSGLAGGAIVSALPTGPTRAATIGDDGLHKQPWFVGSFLDLNDDLMMSADNGKRLAIMIEQRGCPYCREMHEVNLEINEISSYIQDNFDVIQLDMWGSREVTDFDGEAREERAMIQRWQVNFTPTIMFLPADPAEAEGKSARQVEVARMPGYFKPFHFLSMFEFVNEELYKEQTFQRYLQDKFARYQAEGKDPEVW